MKKWIWIGAVAVVVIFFYATYNGFVNKEEGLKGAWADVETQYQRRADLIPNLVSTVKGYAAHETQTLNDVTEARARATSINLSADDLTPEKLAQFQQAQAQVNAAVDAALSAQQAKAGAGLTMNGGAAAAGFAMNSAVGAAGAGSAKNGGVGTASAQARMGAGFLDTTGLPAADADGNITFRAYAEGDSGSGELYTYNGQTGQLHRGGTDARTHATDMLDAYRNGDYIEYKDLIVNKSNYAVYYSGHVVEMPPKELELLYFLASSPNQVFTREQLLDHIWGYEFAGDSRTVDVHIKRLREKLPGNPDWEISTVWGIGYKFRVI